MTIRCALINRSSGRVENLIIAAPSIDVVEEGFMLIANPPSFVVIGTAWDGSKFVDRGLGVTTAAPIDGVETL